MTYAQRNQQSEPITAKGDKIEVISPFTDASLSTRVDEIEQLLKRHVHDGRETRNISFPDSGITFGGTGSDGDLYLGSSSSIDLGGVNVFVKNYRNITILSGATLSFINPASTGTIIIFRATGSVQIHGTINVDSLGAAGGLAASTGNAQNGSDAFGTIVYNQDEATGLYSAAALIPLKSKVGGGLLYDSAGAFTLGIGGCAVEKSLYLSDSDGLFRRSSNIICGSGGAAGQDGANSGNGGRGGGALMLEVGSDLNFTGTITANGAAGSANVAVNNGGGGGGGGGMVVILYNVLAANSGTITTNGGAGGAGNGTGTGGGGAGGIQGVGADPVIFSNFAIRDTAASGGTGESGGANGTGFSGVEGGGGGSGGSWFVAQNTFF